ncbi:MAG: glyceraldehyde 3-phosphate dehydrogenase NAD-binding domain-containing protein, partial [Patescibacteria group bacterium]
MKKTRVAINGFGRIGRAFLKIAKDRKEIEIVAINDLGSLENFVYLLKYDTVYGKSIFDIKSENTTSGQFLVVDGEKIKFLSEKEPKNLPWKSLDIDVVVESSGFFTSFEKSKAHLDAGAKRVV